MWQPSYMIGIIKRIKKGRKMFQNRKIQKYICSFFFVQLFLLKKKMNFQELWNKVFTFSQQHPIDFYTYYQDHQIKKLSLPHLKLYEIKEQVSKFSQKYQANYAYTSKIWMENEYRVFIWTVFYFAKMNSRPPFSFDFNDWQELSIMFNKSPIICNYFYRCCRKGKSQAWTPEEDEFLKKTMSIPEYESRWTDIGILFFVQSQTKSFHSPKSVRERWLSHLNPIITKEEWTHIQDLAILNFVLENGKKWSKISKMLINRSEHAVKNRYNSLIFKTTKGSREELRKSDEKKMIRKYKLIIEKKLKMDEEENSESESRKGSEGEEKVGQFSYQTNFFVCYLAMSPVLIQDKLT